jgi:signal transduction histidine kinase
MDPLTISLTALCTVFLAWALHLFWHRRNWPSGCIVGLMAGLTIWQGSNLLMAPAESPISYLLVVLAIFGIGTMIWIAHEHLSARPLREMEARYNELFENSPVGIWEEDWSAVKRMIDNLRDQGTVDLDAYFFQHPEMLREAMMRIEVRALNSAALAFSRASDKASIQQTCGDYFTRVNSDRFKAAFVALSAGERRYVHEGWTIAFDDTEIALRIIIQVPEESRESWTRLLVMTEDITDRMQDEAALREAKNAAEQSAQSKSRFLAGASHDLRQPLYAMGLFLSLLASQVKNPEGVALVAKTAASLESLNRLFESLLDISRLESSTITPAISDLPVDDLLERMVVEFAPQAEDEGLELRAVPCSAVIRSDPTLLESVLRNLLSNAVRYTRSGRILLGCRRRGSKLRIEVWDTGIGIPDDQLDSIFQEFHRLPQSSATREVGLGLGLAIVERISRLLGHRVEVSSTPDKGSVFAIEVALAGDDLRGQTIHVDAEAAEPPCDEHRSALQNHRGRRQLTLSTDVRTPKRSIPPGYGS